MYFIDQVKNLWRPKYPSLNRIEILANNLINNLNFLQSLQKKSEMIPVLKANAYGHGLKEIVSILNKTKVKRVAVDSFPEAQIVNRYFKGKSLIIGQMPLEAYSYLNWRKTEVVVYDLNTLENLAKIRKKISVHLFYNSGMNREGIKDINNFLEQGSQFLKEVKVVGFCSHLAAAEDNDNLNEKQINDFYQALGVLKKYKFYPSIVHIGNSAAIFSVKKDFLNAYRVGLSFYGYHNFSSQSNFKKIADNNLKPALRVVSKIVNIIDIKKDEIVSYNSKYKAKQAEKIITLPFGYYEGLDWNLSNSFLRVKLNNRKTNAFLELIGRVSMNLSSWRLVGDIDINIGDEVTIISENKNDNNSINNIAKQINKIPYELLIRLRTNIRKNIIYG